MHEEKKQVPIRVRGTHIHSCMYSINSIINSTVPLFSYITHYDERKKE